KRGTCDYSLLRARQSARGSSSRRLLFKRGFHLVIFRKPACGFLRVDLFSVNKNLEPPVVKRSEAQLTNALFVFGEKLFRQTDGLGLITSRCAVFNANFHTILLPGCRFSFFRYHSPLRETIDRESLYLPLIRDLCSKTYRHLEGESKENRMNWRERCGNKLVSAQEAMKAVRNGDTVQVNWLHATPVTLC